MAGRTRDSLLEKSYSAEIIDSIARGTTRDFYHNLKADLGR